jgi:hypothetical protein
VASLLEVNGSLLARVIAVFLSLRQGIHLVRLLANVSAMVRVCFNSVMYLCKRLLGMANNEQAFDGFVGWHALHLASRSLKLLLVRDTVNVVQSIIVAIWWNHVMWPLFPLNLASSFNDWDRLERNQLIIDYLLIMVSTINMLKKNIY